MDQTLLHSARWPVETPTAPAFTMIRKTLEVARRANTIVSSVGTPACEHGQSLTGYLIDANLEYIRAQGAVGDVCGTYYAREGSLAPIEINQRSIAIGSEELLRVLNRVRVSSGAEKAAASIGAARASLINVLITDENTTSRMLNILDNESSANSEAHSAES